MKVTIVPLAKVFERCLHKQISDFFDTILSKYQCSFRHGAQHCLIALPGKWRESLDRGLEFGILPTDLSKALDCLPHDLFVAKLFAYGFDDKALRVMYDCLKHRKQRTKIADSYSSWQEILYGVSQGSILGPSLFNVNLCDLFFTTSPYGIANYADNNTPYVSGRNIEEVVASLEQKRYQRLSFNGLEIISIGNASKCQGLLSTDKQVHVNIGTAQTETRIVDVS